MGRRDTSLANPGIEEWPLAIKTTSGPRLWLRFILAVAIVTVIGVVLFIAVAVVYEVCCSTRMTVEEAERLIDENLPPGSTAEEISAFLASRNIDHGDFERAGSYTVLQEAGIPPDTVVIGALIRDTHRSLILFTGDIDIFFILDDERKLKDRVIREVFTGP